MRILGIDYGTKKIGLALSDESASFAFPLSVLRHDKNLFKNILEICDKNDVSEIVLGEPGGFKGDPTAILSKIKKFKQELEEKVKLPVVFENEILTTKQVKRAVERKKGELVASLKKRTTKEKLKKNIDSSSAALILQAYLDRKKI